MVTDSRSCAAAGADQILDEESIPTPQRVRQMAAQIRRDWTPRERRRRAQLARYLVAEKFLTAKR